MMVNNFTESEKNPQFICGFHFLYLYLYCNLKPNAMKKSTSEILRDSMRIEHENVVAQIASENLQKPYARVKLSWCSFNVCQN
jgi:hypothetical protein